MFRRDIDYIVKDGKVIIIDEFTGRMMDGRRWSDGLHQAVEAKEGVNIEPENQTLASITFQNYFRMYPKLGGMTGTAATEARILRHLQDERRHDPDQRAGAARTRRTNSTRIPSDKFAGDRQDDPRACSQGPAGAGRHRLDREVRNAVRIPPARKA
jgi:hypothetical protein